MVKKLVFFFSLFTAVITSCTNKHLSDNTTPVSFDLDSIIGRGKLIAVTDYNSTDYFIYRGEPMGFHFELLKQFADHIGIDLELVTGNNPEHSFTLLKTGKVDIIATGLTVSSSGKKDIKFTEAILETREVLVQRKPRNWRTMTDAELSRRLVRNQLALAGKTVYVQENTSHVERLRALENEIGDSLNIVPVPYNQEELIRNVMKGEIDYTVCDENIALVNSRYYPDIDISTPVSFPRNIAWGLRKTGSDKLQNELNKWITEYRNTRAYSMLYAKYFHNSRSAIIVNSDYYTLNTGRISSWDDLIRNASHDINWDWRLMASLVCQESRFDPDVVSRAGAIGLMQVMPGTGEKFGIDAGASPVSNIRAGTLYIRQLQQIFESKVEDPEERLKFILAAYNAGPGHILDAMKLAEKNGLDPQKWDGNVSVYLLKKSDPKFYNDPVVKNGYFKGVESVNFVSEILDRYDHYKNMVTEGNSTLSMGAGK